MISLGLVIDLNPSRDAKLALRPSWEEPCAQAKKTMYEWDVYLFQSDYRMKYSCLTKREFWYQKIAHDKSDNMSSSLWREEHQKYIIYLTFIP